MKQNIALLIAVISLLYFTSCVSLEHINSYAHNSAASLEKFHDINFSFNRFCNEFQPEAITNSLQTDVTDRPKLNCTFFKNADSALNILHQVLLLYIQGLEKISDKGLVDFNLDKTVSSLNSLQDQLGFTLSTSQITAAQNIVTKLLDEALNGYRKNKIKKIILETKDDFDSVMIAYMTGISALESEATLALRNYRDFYTNELLEDSTTTRAVKIFIVKDFREKEGEFTEIEKTIEVYTESLNTILNGYNQMVASAKNLTSDSLKALLKQCVDDIRFLKEQIENLKKDN